jgi:hypothetical protein
MDTTLISVTLLSLAMAGTLSIVVWRLLRDERRRSEARVAALAQMATHTTERTTTSRVASARTTSPPPRRGEPIDLPLREDRSAPAPVSAAPLFQQPETSSPWGHRAAVMAALALALASVVLFGLAVRNHAVAAASTAAPGAPHAPAALELLSLRDARDASTLTITGLVRNPRTGGAQSRVTVTAFAFDESGAFLSSGRALLDVTSLAPGDESPFVVSVPATGNVARYRISFRGEDGRVIAHVDRRQQSAVADSAQRSVAGS